MPRPCPLCEGAAAGAVFPYETRWSERTFRYHRCGACGCSYVDPVPTAGEFERMYAVGQYHDTHYQGSASSAERHGPSLRFLGARAPESVGGQMLDFGCGDGSFMLAARDAGYRVAGVEQSERSAAELAGRTGLDIRSLGARMQAGATFDIIHLGDVLEHLAEPALIFRQLETLLAPGGVFFVEGPLQAHASVVYYTAAAFGHLRHRMGRFRPGSSAPTHLLLATAASQRAFFSSRLGYRVDAFEISESGWPYVNRTAAPARPAEIARRTIGYLAIAAARMPVLRGRLGNRFIAVATPLR